MPGFVGVPELLLLGLVVLLVFGPKRLPEMGRSMGKGLREFKDSISGDDKDKDEDEDEPEDAKPQMIALEGDPLAPAAEQARHDKQVA